MAEHNNKRHIKLKPKETLGVICVERHIHDESVVISGSLLAVYRDDDLNSRIEEALENAARDIRICGGILGQIKTAMTVMSTNVITITDEKASTTEPPQKYVRIVLAAIMFMVDPTEAEEIIRKALAGVRERFKV
jgi:hypothetical protein